MRAISLRRFVVNTLLAIVIASALVACGSNGNGACSPTDPTCNGGTSRQYVELTGFTRVRPASVNNPSQVDTEVVMAFTFPVVSGSARCVMRHDETLDDGRRVYRCHDKIRIPVHLHAGEDQHIVNVSDPAMFVEGKSGSNIVADNIFWPNGQPITKFESTSTGNGTVGRYIQMASGNIQ